MGAAGRAGRSRAESCTATVHGQELRIVMAMSDGVIRGRRARINADEVVDVSLYGILSEDGDSGGRG
jgi:hypothetical protein